MLVTTALYLALAFAFTRLKRMHTKARGPDYPGTSLVKKCEVADEFVKWSVAYDDYKPVEYTSDVVLRKPVWADPDIRYHFVS